MWGGGESPGFDSIPPIMRRILFIREKKKSHDKYMDFLEEGEKVEKVTLLERRNKYWVKQHVSLPSIIIDV